MPAGSPSLEERVAAFPQWHYEFDLDGVITPIFRSDHRNRHAQRERYMFDPLLRLCGGSLAGKTVLDLGCNAGFWGLKALEAGAEFVLGVDGRQMHIDQAQLVMETKRIEPSRYRFVRANVFEWEPEDQFDVVLCFGLLYHVCRPVELLERSSRWNRDLLVIDSNISRLPGNAIEVRREDIDDPRASIEYELVFVPTRNAVLEMCKSVGYQDVVALRPRFTSWEGSRDFEHGARRAFIASKGTRLAGLDEDRAGLSVLVRDIGHSGGRSVASYVNRHWMRRESSRVR